METKQTSKEITSFETLRTMLHDITEQQKETEQNLKESAERLGKQLGRLNNCFDEMVESMVMPYLVGKFRDIGLFFAPAYPHTVIYDDEYNILTEIDITLENRDKVMIIEAKSKPTIEDITDHIERMEKLRLHAVSHGDKRKYLGAIAGIVFDKNEKQYALKNGFYLVEPRGKTCVITEPGGNCPIKE
jgi:hypothetical protein